MSQVRITVKQNGITLEAYVALSLEAISMKKGVIGFYDLISKRQVVLRNLNDRHIEVEPNPDGDDSPFSTIGYGRGDDLATQPSPQNRNRHDLNWPAPEGMDGDDSPFSKIGYGRGDD